MAFRRLRRVPLELKRTVTVPFPSPRHTTGSGTTVNPGCARIGSRLERLFLPRSRRY